MNAVYWPCPACRTALARIHPSHGVFACAGCGGVWADGTAWSTMRGLADPSIASVSQAAAVRARFAAPADVQGRHCPACGAPLTQTRVVGISIDTCMHGTWFDRGEIPRLAQALAANRQAARADESRSSGGEIAVGVIEVLLEFLGGLANN